jgi:aspartate/methionine/tyrosine aminotransferase
MTTQPTTDETINHQLQQMQESATIQLADRVRRLQAAGQKIIALQTGDPDFITPAPIIEAATRAMTAGQTHYVNSRGLPSLRRAIAAKLKAENGLEYDPESEILVTSGGVHACYCAFQAILNPGDQVLVPDPIWMTHANMPLVMRGAAVRVPSLPEDDFWPTLAAWEAALTDRTVALVINTPNNPSGMVASRAYLEQLNAFAAAHGLFVLTDEVYEKLLFNGHTHTRFAALPGAKARTLFVNSFSKTYAMTGWRVGYLAAPAPVIDQALKASQFSITNLAPFIQEAAAFALGSPAVDAQVQQMVAAYSRRADLAMSIYQVAQADGGTKIRLKAPEGAFYLFIDARALGRGSVAMAEDLLDNYKVAVVPGAVYGAHGEGFLRMTIAAADSEVEAGMRAILAWSRA